MENQSKDNHAYLWSDVIRKVLYCISEKGPNYRINDPHNMRHSICNEIDEYVKMTKKAMCKEGEDVNKINIDRHKFASCVCGAIIKARPIGKEGKQWVRNANELVALQVSMLILQRNMIYDFIGTLNISDEDKVSMKQFLIDNFQMKFPSILENICEKQDYASGLCADLSRTYNDCEYKKGRCCHFDVFAYSRVFYYIEMYNRKRFNDVYQDYLNAKHTAAVQ